MKFWNYVKHIVPAVALIGASMTAMPASAKSVLETIQQRGKLIVGLSTFVPWAMRDKQGNIMGFEVDVANKLAQDMGVKAEFVPTAWSGIIPALLAEKFDIIISGMSITPERNMTVNFTIPYAHSGQEMAANKALAGNFKSLDDYNDSKVTITCRRGATPCTLIQKMFPKANLLQFDDDAQAFQEVLNGKAHATISSGPKPSFWAEANKDKIFLANNGQSLSHGDEAFGLRKGDPDALNFFSNWILVNDSNGWLQERHDYWFKGQDAWKDLVAPTQ
jgi:polar amino acid transport system substrate-binding protein